MKGGFYSRREIAGLVQNARHPVIEPYRAFGAGKVFFVDVVNGSDGNDGDDPENALASITAALAKCVSGRDDYIICIKHWYVPDTDAPITIAKTDVHLIALSNGNWDSGQDLIASAGLVAITILDAGYDFEIAGFNIGGGATVPAMHGGEIYRAHIHHCGFGTNAACTLGLTYDGTGSFTHSKIDHCIFGTEITVGGIYIPLNSSIIEKCSFRHDCGVCINGVAIFLNVDVIGNSFIIPDVGPGEAITVIAGSTGCFFDENVAAEGKTDPGQIPWLDAGVANFWGRNYRGITAVHPG